jgi:hypothetical protein
VSPFAYVPAGQIPQTLAVVLCTWPPGHSQTEAPGALSLPAWQVALAVPLPSPQLPAAHLWQAVDTPSMKYWPGPQQTKEPGPVQRPTAGGAHVGEQDAPEAAPGAENSPGRQARHAVAAPSGE